MAENLGGSTQKQGVINKCPNCGGSLKAFASNCEYCEHELSGIGANATVSDLVARFAEVESELSASGMTGSKLEKELQARRARIIRDFPVPNAREDLLSLIYYIRPKIDATFKADANAEDWRVKMKEVLSLAKNAYRGDAKTRAEFEVIEQSLNTTMTGALQNKAKRFPLLTLGLVGVATLIAIGLGSTQYEKRQIQQCEAQYIEGAATETKRLEEIVTAIATKQKDKQFEDARSMLNGVNWTYQQSCMVDAAKREKLAWEAKRQALLEQTQQLEQAERGRVSQEAEREAAEKRADEAKKTAEELARRAKEMSGIRKANTNKEW